MNAKRRKEKNRPSLVFMTCIYAWLNQPSCNNIETLSGSAGQSSVERIIVTDLKPTFPHVQLKSRMFLLY